MTLVDGRYHQNTVGVVRENLSSGLHRNCGWAVGALVLGMGLRRRMRVCFVLLLDLLKMYLF